MAHRSAGTRPAGDQCELCTMLVTARPRAGRPLPHARPNTPWPIEQPRRSRGNQVRPMTSETATETDGRDRGLSTSPGFAMLDVVKRPSSGSA